MEQATKPQFRLLKSYDGGWHYSEDRRADTPAELLDRCRELDQGGWRWYVEDPNGKVCLDLPCAIHAGIVLGFLKHE